MKTVKEIKVRGYHLDVYAHVNNARYVEFLEEARWDYLERNGVRLEEYGKKGLAFNVVRIDINYRRGAVLGDVLHIETRVGRIGNRSMTMLQTIMLGETGTVIADAEVTFVFVDEKTGKAVVIDRGLLGDWDSEADLPAGR